MDTKMWIDGRRFTPHSAVTVDSYDPTSGEVVASIPVADQEDVNAAVEAATRALNGAWADFTPSQRQRVIGRVGQLLRDNAVELAALDTQEMGMPTSRSVASVISAADFLDWYAAASRQMDGRTIATEHGRRKLVYTVKRPVGVVGAITPWNVPTMMMIWKLGPVLATGCTIVHKPAETSSLSALRVAQLCKEAGLPDGVLNVVTGTGDTGRLLVEHNGIAKIAFTGSVSTGQRIIEASSGNVKRLSLELGGKSPNIIFEDADLTRAVPSAAASIFGNCGQICTAGSRLLVHESIHDRVVAELVKEAHKFVPGDPGSETTTLGPLASSQHRDRVLDYVKIGVSEGAKILTGGGSAEVAGCEGGYFVEPTIFGDVDPSMRIAQEEIFGPVLTVIKFRDYEEAISIANGTHYGLGAYVWSQSMSTAFRAAEDISSGSVSLNSVGNLDAAVPIGGVGMSGYGRELGLEHMDEYLTVKSVWVSTE